MYKEISRFCLCYPNMSGTSICKCWVFAHNSISNQVAPIIVVFLWRGWAKYHQKVINFHQLKTFNGTNDAKLFAAEMFQAAIICRRNIYTETEFTAFVHSKVLVFGHENNKKKYTAVILWWTSSTHIFWLHFFIALNK